jgi:hypothetical protein
MWCCQRTFLCCWLLFPSVLHRCVQSVAEGDVFDQIIKSWIYVPGKVTHVEWWNCMGFSFSRSLFWTKIFKKLNLQLKTCLYLCVLEWICQYCECTKMCLITSYHTPTILQSSCCDNKLYLLYYINGRCALTVLWRVWEKGTVKCTELYCGVFGKRLLLNVLNCTVECLGEDYC